MTAQKKPVSMHLLFVCVACVACTEESPSQRGGTSAGNQAGSECAVTNLTQRCTDCGEGHQVCTAARTWGVCTCAQLGGDGAGSGADVPLDPTAVPQGNLDQSITFEWSESQSEGGVCQPGRYEGGFDGTYCFSVGGWGGGMYGPPSGTNCGSSNANPVMGLSPTGAPGLVFDLTQSGSGEILMINGGKFEGTSNGFIPFSADLANGKLDCSTTRFTADIVNGQYTFGGQTYPYEGLLTADYNKTTHTLVNGVWEVWEPATFNMNGTGHMGATNWGKGTWTASWVP